MNLLKFALLALVGIAIFAACNQKNANQAQEEPAPPPPPVTDTSVEKPAPEKPTAYQVLGYQKTPCFGKCPVYEVKFFNDNTATWYGRMNVEREGWYEAKVEGKVIKDIQMKADALGYWDFNEKYPVENEVTDLPTTITMVRVGDMIKTVRNKHDAPTKLEEFEKYLSDAIEKLDWKVSANRD